MALDLVRIDRDAVDRDDGGERGHGRDDREQRGAGGEHRHLAEQRVARRAQPAREARRHSSSSQSCQRFQKATSCYVTRARDRQPLPPRRRRVRSRSRGRARARRRAGVDGHPGAGDPAAHVGRACARSPRAAACGSRSASIRRSCPELDAGELALTAEALARAARDAGAVAIGECGLDGATGERELQEQLLRLHIRAARLAKLPLVVHVLRAHDARAADPARGARARGRRRAAQLLRRRRPRAGLSRPRLRVLVRRPGHVRRTRAGRSRPRARSRTSCCSSRPTRRIRRRRAIAGSAASRRSCRGHRGARRGARRRSRRTSPR